MQYIVPISLISEFTWGTIPVLELSEHPGQMISQSSAIARFLAKRFDLAGGMRAKSEF